MLSYRAYFIVVPFFSPSWRRCEDDAGFSSFEVWWWFGCFVAFVCLFSDFYFFQNNLVICEKTKMEGGILLTILKPCVQWVLFLSIFFYLITVSL